MTVFLSFPTRDGWTMLSTVQLFQGGQRSLMKWGQLKFNSQTEKSSFKGMGTVLPSPCCSPQSWSRTRTTCQGSLLSEWNRYLVPWMHVIRALVFIVTGQQIPISQQNKKDWSKQLHLIMELSWWLHSPKAVLCLIFPLDHAKSNTNSSVVSRYDLWDARTVFCMQ